MIHIIWTLFIFPLYADYVPTLKALSEGRYSLFKELALEEIQKESVVLKRRELLKIISTNKQKLYNPDNYRGVVLPFNNGSCTANQNQEHICSTYRDYEFLLEENGNSQNFIIRYKKKNILKFQSSFRLKLDSPTVSFGKAVHILFDIQSKQELYLLIREIESPPSSTISLLHTMNVFRIDGNRVCRIVESNVTGNDSTYELITEYVRNFGRSTKCSQSVLTI